jgi:nicotinamide-nucleotide amidase
VYVAIAGPGGPAVRRLDLHGGREAIRTAAVVEALHLLTDELHAAAGEPSIR